MLPFGIVDGLCLWLGPLEANTPLTGKRFWERIEELLTLVSELLPKDLPVICMADRAFGTPAFTDLLVKRGWHYVVRVQGQTLCQDRTGKTCRVEIWCRQLGNAPR